MGRARKARQKQKTCKQGHASFHLLRKTFASKTYSQFIFSSQRAIQVVMCQVCLQYHYAKKKHSLENHSEVILENYWRARLENKSELFRTTNYFG